MTAGIYRSTYTATYRAALDANNQVIGFHVKALRRLGCTRQELEEMLTVCVYMGGGPALMYTAEALAAWDAFAPAQA